jgi:hypothetical protein
VVDYSTSYEAWPRRLWDLGTVLALRELHESCAWVAEGALHQPAVDWQKRGLLGLLGPQRALGDGHLRRALTEILKGTLQAPSATVRRLADLIDLIDAGYLSRHASELDSGAVMSVERLARTVSSHLLDSGFSMLAVRRWALQHRDQGMSPSDLLRDAQALLDAGPRGYEVLLPCLKIPQRQALAAGVAAYRPRREAVDWFEERGHPVPTPLDGAFCFTISARDPYTAADQARELAERLMARDTFGAQGGHLQIADELYADDVPHPLPLHRESRFGRIPSLLQEKQMYTVTAERGRLDAALELAAPLNDGSIAAAVSGAWAAAESLLFSGADRTSEKDERGRVVVATRLAKLVACSWPRAELTALSYRLDPTSDPALYARLDQIEANQERAAVLEQALRDGTAITPAQSSRAASDTRALERMRQLVADPAPVLHEVALVCEMSFRRLYRSRNVIAHAGATSALAHAATLRVTAPLLGAAFDRIAHAYLVKQVDPLVLAAQAENSLELVGDSLGRPLTELLE